MTNIIFTFNLLELIGVIYAVVGLLGIIIYGVGVQFTDLMTDDNIGTVFFMALLIFILWPLFLLAALKAAIKEKAQCNFLPKTQDCCLTSEKRKK